MRVRPRLAVLLLAVMMLAGCQGSDGVDGSDGGDETATPSATMTGPLGPQICGTVTAVGGEEVSVEIIDAAVDCGFAEDLLDTYYNDPPSTPEGSGGNVSIGEWECNSSSTQQPERASTCRGPDDGLIVARPLDSPTEESPTS